MKKFLTSKNYEHLPLECFNENKVWNIVYPYRIPKENIDNCYELRNSFRSIYKNFKGDFKITLIGDIPDWVNRKEVICIELDNLKITAQRQTKINEKIMKATEYYDDFIVFNDDIYILKETKPFEFCIPRIHQTNLGNREFNTIFEKQTFNTIKELEKINIFNKLNTVVHCPYWYQSEKIEEINKKISFTPYGDKSVVFEVLYFNYFDYFTLFSKKAKGFRVGCYNTKNEKIIREKLKDAIIFNHDENGFRKNPWIIDILKNKFPEKCLGEI